MNHSVMNMKHSRLMRRTAAPGVVIVIALLGMFMLAGMVFYVFNAGTQLQQRTEAQQAADAAAIASATQMARTFNLVAHNNETMARMLAIINVLDSLPMAVAFTVRDETDGHYGDVEAIGRVVRWQLQRGVSSQWTRRMLERLMDPRRDDGLVQLERDLEQLHNLFETQPNLVPNITHYNAPNGGRGQAWQAMEALDLANMTMMSNLSRQMQLAAYQSGQWNLSQEQAMALSLPLQVQLPWTRGHFNDFERPVRRGLLPGSDSDEDLEVSGPSASLGQVDDPVTNRGPFDTVFGWRYFDGRRPHSGGWIPGPGRPPTPTGANPGTPATFYRTYGIQTWMRWQIPHAHYSRLRQHLNRLARIKVTYAWNPNARTRRIVEPAWEIDVSTDRERSHVSNEQSIYDLVTQQDGPRIRETMFLVTEIKSRIPNNPGSITTQGVNWNYIQRSGLPQPLTVRRRGWRDPRTGPPMRIRSTTPVEYRQISNYIWRASATYETTHDPSIGLQPQITGQDEDGHPIYAMQTVYWEMEFILIGVNVGEPVPVPNPYRGLNRDEAPAPVDIVQDDMFWDTEHNQSPFLHVLGIAQQENTPVLWTARFGEGRLYSHNVAIAQARVFNNHSRDLWTPMWYAQLAPVDNYNQWVSQFEHGLEQGVLEPELNPTQANDLVRYLRSLEEIAPVTLSH